MTLETTLARGIDDVPVTSARIWLTIEATGDPLVEVAVAPPRTSETTLETMLARGIEEVAVASARTWLTMEATGDPVEEAPGTPVEVIPTSERS
jgi:hypothetical protein